MKITARNITSRLGKLIVEPVSDEQMLQENIANIKKLLEFSKDCSKKGFKELVIDFSTCFKTDEGESLDLFLLAIRAKKLEVVKLLLASGFYIDRVEANTGIPPLFFAGEENQLAIVEYLIDLGANINQHLPEKKFATALHAACAKNAHAVLEYLLLSNADPDLANKEGRTPVLDANQTGKKLLATAKHLRQASNQLREGEIYKALVSLNGAFTKDTGFTLSYLAKIARITNLRSQGLAHDEIFYQPYLLRLAIKQLKTIVKTFPDFDTSNFQDKNKELLIYLNGYDPNSPHFDDAEKIFRTTEEKTKTLRWLEVTTTFAETKLKMKEKDYINFMPTSSSVEKEEIGFSQAQLVLSAANHSPIYTSTSSSEQNTSQPNDASLDESTTIRLATLQ